ncbi:hypothetical protein [Streptomyces virginiae]|uniref:hypothetical protein n=1 Tax=Streptomyces virginiae TaxID=1961 RepID=UPI003428AABC
MREHKVDPAAARKLLRKRCRRYPRLWMRWSRTALDGRISRMTDRQVFTALALSQKELKAAVRAQASAAGGSTTG